MNLPWRRNPSPTPLISAPPSRPGRTGDSTPPSGSGLIGWLEQTRVQLPLKGVEVSFDLRGDLLEVGIDQIYHQNLPGPIDVTYTFPLPAGAAVHRCQMQVNDRVITARVRPVEEARRLAREMKELGHRTALVESVRENLFELELGNLAPGDTVVIRLAYFQTLDRADAGAASFRIPLTPGIRYIPGTPLLRRNLGTGTADDTDLVPDASRLSPPRIDELHPDAAYLACQGTIGKIGWDAEGITSPSHPLLLRTDGESVGVTLASNGAVPDSDLVIRLTTAPGEAVQTAAWTTTETEFTYAAVRLVAPPVPAGANPPPRDFFFLIDRSGSMRGAKWTACARAFREFLGRLGPLDRGWVTFFESSFQDLAEKPLPAAAILAEPSVARLEELGTLGGTELFPALVHVLEKLDRHSAPEREPSLVIITDGQVGDEVRIHELLERRKRRVRVHAFGIDHAVNDAFLKQLGEESGGSCTLATPQDDLVGLVAGVARRMGTAVVRGTRLEGAWEPAGRALPDLWEGDAVTLSARVSGEATEVIVHGESASGEPVLWTIPLVPAESPAPRLLWQRQRIQILERERSFDEATTLACEANLLSSGTAFLAWDETERVAVSGPNLLIHQPSLAPPCHHPALYSFQESAVRSCDDRLPRVLNKAFCLVRPPAGSPPMPMEAPRVKEPTPPAPLARDPATPPAPAPVSAPLREFPALLGLRDDAGIQLADWLEQWVWLVPGRKDEREETLRCLTFELLDLPFTLRPKQFRRKRFRAWVAANVESPIREAIERLVPEG